MPAPTAIQSPRGSALAEVLAYPVEPDPIPWAVENIRFPPEREAFERFDPALTPWVGRVIAWMLDDSVEVVYLIQGSQTSKTLSMMLGMTWLAHFRPGNTAWISATEGEATGFVTERLQPMIEASGWRPAAKHDWKDEAFMVGRSLVRALWASSAAKLRERAYRYVFGDECAVWPASLRAVGEPIAYAMKRTRQFAGRGRKCVFGTTPRDPEMAAWKYATAAAFHQWWVPCPHCGEFFFLSFSRNIRFGECKRKDGTWDLDRARRRTYCVCEQCGSEIHEADKLAMLAAGRLQRVDPATYEPAEAKPSREVALQIPATYSVVTTWGELAVSFLKAKAAGAEVLRIFVTDELAEPWHEEGEAPGESVIRACIDRERARGSVPPEALVLTAGVDIQKDRILYVVRAWGADWRSWLVAHAALPWDAPGVDGAAADPGRLAFLDDVLLGEYGGRHVDFTFIDSGYLPSAVCEYVGASRERMRVMAPSKGMPGDRSYLVRATPYEKRRDGRPNPRGLKLYLLNTSHWMLWVHEHMKVPRGDPGEWRLDADTENDPEYLAQLLNSQRIERVTRGRKIWTWEMKSRTVGRDYHHCEAYCAAAAWYPVGLASMTRRRSPSGGAGGGSWSSRRRRR